MSQIKSVFVTVAQPPYRPRTKIHTRSTKSHRHRRPRLPRDFFRITESITVNPSSSCVRQTPPFSSFSSPNSRVLEAKGSILTLVDGVVATRTDRNNKDTALRSPTLHLAFNFTVIVLHPPIVVASPAPCSTPLIATPFRRRRRRMAAAWGGRLTRLRSAVSLSTNDELRIYS